MIERFPVVAHTFLLRSNSVLMVRRTNTGFQDGSYGPAGGHLEDGETIKQAAIRECKEEIGVIITPSALEITGVTHYKSADSEGIDFFLTTQEWIGEPYPKSECDDVQWYPVNRLPQGVLPFVRRAIKYHLINGNWFDEIRWKKETLSYV